MLPRITRIALLVVLLAAIGWGAYNMALITIKKYTLQQKIIQLKAQAQALSDKHSDLLTFLDSFKDPAILEQQLKRRLNVKKQGEQVVVLVPASPAGGPVNGAPDAAADKNSAGQATNQLLANLDLGPQTTGDNAPTWQKWWNLFFGDKSTPAK